MGCRRVALRSLTAYVVMAYIVMAYIFMARRSLTAWRVMAYIVMAYIVMARRSLTARPCGRESASRPHFSESDVAVAASKENRV